MNFLIIPMALCGVFLVFYHFLPLGNKERLKFTIVHNYYLIFFKFIENFTKDMLLAVVLFILVVIDKVPDAKTTFETERLMQFIITLAFVIILWFILINLIMKMKFYLFFYY